MDINGNTNLINIEKFAVRLCEEIERKGYIKKQFADLINITSTALQNITSGKNLPSLQNYVNMCEVLKLPFVYLLRDSVNEPELIGSILESDLADLIKGATAEEKRKLNDIVKAFLQ